MTDSISDTELDLSKLKVADLKSELKKRGLSTEGKKNELLERLQTSIGDAALLDDPHDDLLDEDAYLAEDEVLNDSLPGTPPPISSLKRPAEELNVQSKKKIILNRKSVSELPVTESEPDKNSASSDLSPPIVSSQDASDLKIVKLGEFSPEERMRRRAARFGGAKVAPVAATTKAVSNTLKGIPVETSIDVLKKRAERFGTVAPVLEKAELEERKKKRLARFGGASAAQVTKSVAADTDDKKAQRAQRFQITT